MSRVPIRIATPGDVSRHLEGMQERERETRVHTSLRKRAFYFDGFPGALIASSVNTPPAGFIRADGQGVTTDFPDLRQAYLDEGSLHGVDGSGNPRTPNLNANRFVRGAATPGGTGGSLTNSHTTGAASIAMSPFSIGTQPVTVSPTPQGHTHDTDVQDNQPPYTDAVWFVRT